MEVDMAADMLIFAKLRECGAVETASSEETAECVELGGHGFSVRSLTCLFRILLVVFRLGRPIDAAHRLTIILNLSHLHPTDLRGQWKFHLAVVTTEYGRQNIGGLRVQQLVEKPCHVWVGWQIAAESALMDA